MRKIANTLAWIWPVGKIVGGTSHAVQVLINREIYKEDGINKKIKIDVGRASSPRDMDLDEMIKYIVRAGYEVRKGTSGGG